MHILLYNPLSAKGKGFNKYQKFCDKLIKQNKSYKGFNLLDLDGQEKEFISSLDKDDVIVIIGGDGTLHQVINRIKGLVVKNRVFFYRAGSGNDYSRDHKSKFFEITEELKFFPKFISDGQETYFINGVGMGIDAAVCAKVNDNQTKNIQESYYKTAVKTFKSFKQFPIKITIDGIESNYEKVWFAVIQNGRYFGGGMKIAPKAKRLDDYLDIYIIHKIKLYKLLFIFPLIFIGKHIWFKKYVIGLTGKHIIIESPIFNKMQHDGEVLENIHRLEVIR